MVVSEGPLWPQQHFSGYLLLSQQRLNKLKCRSLEQRKVYGLPRWRSAIASVRQCGRCRRHGFDPCIKMILWSKKRQPIPEFLPGEFHGQKSLAGYSPWCSKESDTTERLSTHTSRETRPPKLKGPEFPGGLGGRVFKHKLYDEGWRLCDLLVNG